MFTVGQCLERKQCCRGKKCVWSSKTIKINGCNPIPARIATCYSFADPHFVGFKGNRFDAQEPGHFQLYIGEKLRVSYDAKKNGAWAAIIKVEVHLRGKHFSETTDFKQKTWCRKNFMMEQLLPEMEIL